MPQEPMQTPHPTSQSPHAPSASPRRARRRSKLALAGALVLLVLLTVAGPAAAFSTQYAFTIDGHGWGHGVGMSQWGAYGYAKHGWVYKDILKHYYTGISFSNVDDSLIRVNLRSGLSAVKLSCPNEYTVQGSGAAWTHPGRHDRDDHLVEPRLQRRRRLAAQDLQRGADVHAQVRRAAPHHQDRPGRRRRLPRHHQGGAQRRSHDDQPRAAGELPARRGTARGLAQLAERGAQDPGLRGARVRARAAGSRASPGTSTATSATRPTWASASRTRAPTPPCAAPPASAPPTAASPSWRPTSPAPAGRPRTSRTSGEATTPISRASTTPTTPTARCTTGARCAARLPDRRPARRQRLGPRRLHAQARRLAAHRQGGDHRQQRDQRSSTAAPCA